MRPQSIITAARSWIGTRFHHQGRVKKNGNNKGGCDCIGLIIGVADELDIKYKGRPFSGLDKKDYAKTPDGKELYDSFCKYLTEIDIGDAKAGDILMFRFDKYPQHVGFLSDIEGVPAIIHCYLQARGVVEHRMDEYWRSRIVAAFRFIDNTVHR